MYVLDHIVIMLSVVMQCNLDEVNSNFRVIFRGQWYYSHCNYAIQCGGNSDQ